MGVNIRAADTNLKVQVRPLCMARVTSQADQCASSYYLATLNVDLAKVGVESDKPIAVVNLNYIAVAIIIAALRHCHDASRRRKNWSAFAGGKINTKMRW